MTKDIEEMITNELGNKIWIQVCGDHNIFGYRGGLWCGFVKKENVDNVFRDAGWDIKESSSFPGFIISGDKTIYQSNNLSDDGFEALLYNREFYGMADDYVELSQEFILLNNLRYDENSHAYYVMYNNGESEEAVRYKDQQTIEIKFKFIRQYIAAKQLVFLLYFDYHESAAFDNTTNNKEVKTEELFYTIGYGRINPTNNKWYTRVLGKKLWYPLPVEKCNYWPYEKGEAYSEFDISENQDGSIYKFTCDPDKLANDFGKNPEAPHYFTPIAFKKEVLKKYYDQPEKYTIQDGKLICGSLWSLPIDNDHKDFISVYLGDIGEKLPESERMHWREYNTIVDDPLSITAFQRDFANIPADSETAEHQFQANYLKLNREWKEKYGWTLFLEGHDDIEISFDQIRRPLVNSAKEFEELLLDLVKILIDGLNEKDIKNHLEEVHKNLRGIKALGEFLSVNGFKGFEEHITFLNKLYKLRSSGVAHLKGKNYQKDSRYFHLTGDNYTESFTEILVKANAFLRYLRDSLK